MTLENTSQQIAQLNDAFRQTFLGGQVVITAGVQSLPPGQQQAVFQVVQAFNIFTEDNDLHGEHDFGTFSLHNERFNWKIDYYDPSMQWGSEDPTDPQQWVPKNYPQCVEWVFPTVSQCHRPWQHEQRLGRGRQLSASSQERQRVSTGYGYEFDDVAWFPLLSI